jgi:hypothetical protein
MAKKNSTKVAVKSRFVDNGNGTVTDISTGLMWIKNPHTDLPERLKGTLAWQNAIDACKELDFAGKKDWRLPTVEELRSLVDYTRGKGDEPAIDTAIFPDTKTSWYWTSTPCAWSSDNAWCVVFSSGFVSSGSKDSSGSVRPVRSSK